MKKTKILLIFLIGILLGTMFLNNLAVYAANADYYKANIYSGTVTGAYYIPDDGGTATIAFPQTLVSYNGIGDSLYRTVANGYGSDSAGKYNSIIKQMIILAAKYGDCGKIYTTGDKVVYDPATGGSINLENSKTFVSNLYYYGKKGKAQTKSMLGSYLSDRTLVNLYKANLSDTDVSGIFSTKTRAEFEAEKKLAKDARSADIANTFGGIDRSNPMTQKANADKISQWIFDVSMPFLALIVFIAIIVIGFKSISRFSSNDKERIVLMESFKNIIIGVIIVALSFLFVNVAFNQIQTTMDKMDQLGGTTITDGSGDAFAEETSPTTFMSLICSGLEWVIGEIRRLLHALLTPILGYPSIEELITMQSAGNTISDATDEIYLRPFTNSQLEVYNLAYKAIFWVTAPLLLIAILKTGFLLIIHSNNYGQTAQAKDDARRIVLAILLCLCGPYIFKAILMFFNMMTLLIPFTYSQNLTSEMATGNLLGDIIGGFYMFYIELQIFMVFLVRQVVLTVMYVITPLVAFAWAISKQFKLMQIWWGEIITNSATQFIYAIVFFVATIGLNPGSANKVNWLLYLVWMTLVIKIAKALKMGLQTSYFGAMSGVDEESAAKDLTNKAMVPVTAAKGVASSYANEKFTKFQNDHNADGTNRWANAAQNVKSGYKAFRTGKGDINDFSFDNRAFKERQKKQTENIKDYDNQVTQLSRSQGVHAIENLEAQGYNVPRDVKRKAYMDAADEMHGLKDSNNMPLRDKDGHAMESPYSKKLKTHLDKVYFNDDGFFNVTGNAAGLNIPSGTTGGGARPRQQTNAANLGQLGQVTNAQPTVTATQQIMQGIEQQQIENANARPDTDAGSVMLRSLMDGKSLTPEEIQQQQIANANQHQDTDAGAVYLQNLINKNGNKK